MYNYPFLFTPIYYLNFFASNLKEIVQFVGNDSRRVTPIIVIVSIIKSSHYAT